MNIHDYQSGVELEDLKNIWDLIYSKQISTGMNYIQIEIKNNLRISPSIPLNLDLAVDQSQMKDFLWRITEEIAESNEALDLFIEEAINNDGKFDLQSQHLLHAKEEMDDALHFLTEAIWLSGLFENLNELCIDNEKLSDMYKQQLNFLNVETVIDYATNYEFMISESLIEMKNHQLFTKTITSLGLIGNTLKNKPWKTSQVQTDKEKTKKLFIETFQNFIEYCLYLMEPMEIIDLYFRKNQVNDFRRRTQY